MPPKARGAAKTPNEALVDELRKASAACAEAIKKVAGTGSDKQFERINKAEKAWVKLLSDDPFPTSVAASLNVFIKNEISDLDIHHDLLYRYLSTGLAALHELIVKPSLLIFTEEAMAQKLAEQSVAVKASREVLLRTSTLMASIAERISDLEPSTLASPSQSAQDDIDFALNLLKDLRGGQVDRATASDQLAKMLYQMLLTDAENGGALAAAMTLDHKQEILLRLWESRSATLSLHLCRALMLTLVPGTHSGSAPNAAQEREAELVKLFGAATVKKVIPQQWRSTLRNAAVKVKSAYSRSGRDFMHMVSAFTRSDKSMPFGCRLEAFAIDGVSAIEGARATTRLRNGDMVVYLDRYKPVLRLYDAAGQEYDVCMDYSRMREFKRIQEGDSSNKFTWKAINPADRTQHKTIQISIASDYAGHFEKGMLAYGTQIKTPLSPFQKSSRTVEHIGSDGIERATTPTQAKRNAYASDDEDGGGEKEEEDMADGGDDSQSSATKRRLALLETANRGYIDTPGTVRAPGDASDEEDDDEGRKGENGVLVPGSQLPPDHPDLNPFSPSPPSQKAKHQNSTSTAKAKKATGDSSSGDSNIDPVPSHVSDSYEQSTAENVVKDSAGRKAPSGSGDLEEEPEVEEEEEEGEKRGKGKGKGKAKAKVKVALKPAAAPAPAAVLPARRSARNTTPAVAEPEVQAETAPVIAATRTRARAAAQSLPAAANPLAEDSATDTGTARHETAVAPSPAARTAPKTTKGRKVNLVAAKRVDVTSSPASGGQKAKGKAGQRGDSAGKEAPAAARRSARIRDSTSPANGVAHDAAPTAFVSPTKASAASKAAKASSAKRTAQSAAADGQQTTEAATEGADGDMQAVQDAQEDAKGGSASGSGDQGSDDSDHHGGLKQRGDEAEALVAPAENEQGDAGDDDAGHKGRGSDKGKEKVADAGVEEEQTEDFEDEAALQSKKGSKKPAGPKGAGKSDKVKETATGKSSPLASMPSQQLEVRKDTAVSRSRQTYGSKKPAKTLPVDNEDSELSDDERSPAHTSVHKAAPRKPFPSAALSTAQEPQKQMQVPKKMGTRRPTLGEEIASGRAMTPSAADSNRRVRPTRTGRSEEVDEAPSEQVQSPFIAKAEAKSKAKASKDEIPEPEAIAVRQGAAPTEDAKSLGETEKGKVSTAAQRELPEEPVGPVSRGVEITLSQEVNREHDDDQSSNIGKTLEELEAEEAAMKKAAKQKGKAAARTIKSTGGASGAGEKQREVDEADAGNHQDASPTKAATTSNIGPDPATKAPPSRIRAAAKKQTSYAEASVEEDDFQDEEEAAHVPTDTDPIDSIPTPSLPTAKGADTTSLARRPEPHLRASYEAGRKEGESMASSFYDGMIDDDPAVREEQQRYARMEEKRKASALAAAAAKAQLDIDSAEGGSEADAHQEDKREKPEKGKKKVAVSVAAAEPDFAVAAENETETSIKPSAAKVKAKGNDRSREAITPEAVKAPLVTGEGKGPTPAAAATHALNDAGLKTAAVTHAFEDTGSKTSSPLFTLGLNEDEPRQSSPTANVAVATNIKAHRQLRRTSKPDSASPTPQARTTVVLARTASASGSQPAANRRQLGLVARDSMLMQKESEADVTADLTLIGIDAAIDAPEVRAKAKASRKTHSPMLKSALKITRFASQVEILQRARLADAEERDTRASQADNRGKKRKASADVLESDDELNQGRKNAREMMRGRDAAMAVIDDWRDLMATRINTRFDLLDRNKSALQARLTMKAGADIKNASRQARKITEHVARASKGHAVKYPADALQQKLSKPVEEFVTARVTLKTEIRECDASIKSLLRLWESTNAKTAE